MNQVFLMGRLTKDPELRFAQTGKPVCKCVLAVDRQYKNENGESQADFINVVSFGKQAESLAEHMGKGGRCIVMGAIRISRYQGDDGADRYWTEVVANRVQFIDWKNKAGQAPAPADASPAPGQEVPFDQADLPF